MTPDAESLDSTAMLVLVVGLAFLLRKVHLAMKSILIPTTASRQ